MPNDLKHWGVLGMRWGVRNDRTSNGHVRIGRGKMSKAQFDSQFNKETSSGSNADKKFQADLLKLHKSGQGNNDAAVIKIATKYDKAKSAEKAAASLKKLRNKKLSETHQQRKASGQTAYLHAMGIINRMTIGAIIAGGLVVLGQSLIPSGPTAAEKAYQVWLANA